MVTPHFLTSDPETIQVTLEVSSSAREGTCEMGVQSDMAIVVRPMCMDPDHCFDICSTLTCNRKDVFYLTTPSAHFIYRYAVFKYFKQLQFFTEYIFFLKHVLPNYRLDVHVN